jgi:hypothetical protein
VTLRGARAVPSMATRVRRSPIALLAWACALLAARPVAAEPTHEINGVPVIGGDSDVGVGVGGVGDWAALVTGDSGFHWRLEAAGFLTFKEQDGRAIFPYQDFYLDLLVPHAGPRGRFHVDARFEYTNETTLKYTGIGNASPWLPPGVSITRAEYGRIHPGASLEVRTRVTDGIYILGGAQLTFNDLTVPPGTVLAMDHAAGTPVVRELLGDFDAHGVALVTVEAMLDTRDDEIVTAVGQYHTFRLRVSPRMGDWFPYGYERATLTTRFYQSTIGRTLTLSCRLVGDVLRGQSPFYEMARFDETAAIGGGRAVRGVPAQRYYGKLKAFGNLELASALFTFHVRSKPFILGPALFADVGRTWTELGISHPDLDGTGLGLKYGVGGGVRLQEGRTFLVRFDLAWSPDAHPVGVYFAAGNIF